MFKFDIDAWNDTLEKARVIMDGGIYQTPQPPTKWEVFVDKIRNILHGSTYYLFKPIFFTLNWLWAGIQDAWEESKI